MIELEEEEEGESEERKGAESQERKKERLTRSYAHTL